MSPPKYIMYQNQSAGTLYFQSYQLVRLQALPYLEEEPDKVLFRYRPAVDPDALADGNEMWRCIETYHNYIKIQTFEQAIGCTYQLSNAASQLAR